MTSEREAAQTRAGKKNKKIPHRVVPGRDQAVERPLGGLRGYRTAPGFFAIRRGKPLVAV